jgi:hypothetical protein
VAESYLTGVEDCPQGGGREEEEVECQTRSSGRQTAVVEGGVQRWSSRWQAAAANDEQRGQG